MLVYWLLPKFVPRINVLKPNQKTIIIFEKGKTVLTLPKYVVYIYLSIYISTLTMDKKMSKWFLNRSKSHES